MSQEESRFIVAVCTLQRVASLECLLNWLSVQEWPEKSSLLIIDNDKDQSALTAVELFRDNFPVPINYVIEPRVGFASVRNRALAASQGADALCFIDDDAIVPAGWISAMYEAHVSAPNAVIRSRYAHIQHLPLNYEDMTAELVRLGSLELYGPAGTSGLLLPAPVVNEFEFDEYYNESGGEDVDLLFRIGKAQIPEVIARTILLEVHRVSMLSLGEQIRLAIWNGRLATILRERSDTDTRGFRFFSALTMLIAFSRALLRYLVGRKVSGNSHLTLAASRWGMTTAPLSAPVKLGRRPKS